MVLSLPDLKVLGINAVGFESDESPSTHPATSQGGTRLVTVTRIFERTWRNPCKISIHVSSPLLGRAQPIEQLIIRPPEAVAELGLYGM